MVIIIGHLILPISVLNYVSSYGNCCHGVISSYYADKPPTCPTETLNTSRPVHFGVISKRVLLHCETSLSYNVTFSWKKGSEDVTYRAIGNNETLKIDPYNTHDSGSYSCLVTPIRSDGVTCTQSIKAADIELRDASECNVKL